MIYLWRWLFIAMFLFILTFGLKACLVSILSTLACLAGILVSLYSRRKMHIDANMRCYMSSSTVNSVFPSSSQITQATGPSIVKINLNPIVRMHKHDKRLTGSIIIDEPLQEVLFYAFRDYIYAWYHQLSGNEDFPFYIRETVQQVIIASANRSKEVEWVHYATTRLVDDFASHLRLFRKAQAKLKEEKINSAPSNDGNSGSPVPKKTLLNFFFQMETTMERNLCRDLVCTSSTHLNTYLQDLTQVLLYLVLPPEDFNNKALRFFIREILVNCVLLPMISLFTDPDYINQIIVWLCKESLPTPEAFLMVLRSTDSLDELQAVKEKVSHEIALLRSKDTGGDFDAEIKQHLSSLIYVKKAVDVRLRRLQEGNLDTDSIGIPTEIDWKKLTEPGTRLFMLPFDVILTNNIALHYFIEFMTIKNAQGLVFFYHAIEGYKVSAEQQLSSVHLARITKSSEESSNSSSSSSFPTPNICPSIDLEGLRDAAQHIYELFLSEKASLRVKLDDTLLKKLVLRLKTEKPNETWFEDVQARVYEMMQEDQYLGAFRRSSGYIKLLAELDLLKDSGGRSDEDEISFGSKAGVKNPSDDGSLSQFDNLSLSSSEPDDDGISIGSGDRISDIEAAQAIEEINHEDFIITASIYNTGIMHNNGSQYAVYAISVVIQRISTGGTEKWCIVRRYSDFHSFHLALMEKFPSLSTVVQFPGKKTFNNLSRQFLEKRTHLLNTYLQTLLSHHTLSSHKGLQATIFHFLEPGMYDTRQRRQFSKAMGTLVSPLKHSMKSVGDRVKTMPDVLFDGIKDGLVKVLGTGSAGVSKIIPGTLNPAGFPLGASEKVAAGLDIEGDDNIPLRIVLLLMDEVFDLKSKDQWFRRRIVVLLRQIIKATYGDTINRKILDYVGWLTSAEQFAEYVKSFRQSFWPNGSLALPQPERDNHTRMRTRVAAKMILLSSIPDELKHVIGSETTRKGVLSIFEMFQQRELNRRLLLVLMEGILEMLFPDNYLPELFRRLHSVSPHTSSDPMLKSRSGSSHSDGSGGSGSSKPFGGSQSDSCHSVREGSSKVSQR